ncbi:MAG: class I SAM-dependent methyltransferase [Bacteroidota bacterium]
MKKPELIFDYLQYKLTSKNRHGIHSPFVYEFLDKVICDQTLYPEYKRIEAVRRCLTNCKETLVQEDYGGSEVPILKEKSISYITKNSCKNKKYGRLLFRIARYYKPLTILELGTSLGISTMYLAKGSLQSKVFTIEGCLKTSIKAKENFERAGIKNIIQFTGTFDDKLPEVLEKSGQPDLVFFDGNHYKEPSLKYFNACIECAPDNAIFIFDDIRWSRQMKEVWALLCADPRINISVDLFTMGILFIRNGQTKQHFRIRF